jgi:hypothetical protein
MSTYRQIGMKSLQLKGQTRSFYMLACAYALILLGRLYLTTQPPINSTDLLRYIGFGKEFWTYGLAIYNYTPRDFGNTPYSNLWPDLKFIYPAMSMLFFAAVAGIWPSLFFARLVLTLLELANGLLITRITGDKLYGLFYFLNPVSIWWISGEGQYESLVVFFTLLALLHLTMRTAWSYGWLGLAIQAKYWPGVLLPYFLNQERRLRPLVIFVIAFVPSLLFILFSDYIFHIFGSQVMATNCNAFVWDFLDDTRTCGTPMWQLVINAVATYGALLVVLTGIVLDRRNPERWLTYVALLAFIVYYKSISWATSWYLLMFAILAIPIRRPWIRWAVLLLSFVEPIAWAGIFGAPIGWVNPAPPTPYIWGGI